MPLARGFNLIFIVNRKLTMRARPEDMENALAEELREATLREGQ
jgi:hypothetical protein